MPTWILSVLILAAVCPGCAKRDILFERRRDPMPCDEFGGKVSMAMRAEPVASDWRLARQHIGASASRAWSGSVSAPQQFPSGEPSSGNGLPDEPGTMFFAPPRLDRPENSSVSQTGFTLYPSTDNTVFAASYPSPLSQSPAYGSASSIAPAASNFSPPQISGDSLDVADPMDTISSSEGTYRSCVGEMWLDAKQNVCCDYRNYYDRGTMAKLACSLVLGSVLANTSMDQDVQDWYQQDVRSTETDNFAAFWKTFGEGQIFIPSYACLAVAGKFVEDWPVVGPVGDFGARTTRAYLVGAPPLLFMQFMLGASRPGETDHSSHWDPFQDTNSVSGHAFIGAVPFLTAANMTDSFVLRTGLYACSTLTGFSRINDDCHYLSQVILGWWMAYLACEAVDQTQFNRHGMTFMPIATGDSVGFGAIYEY